MRSVPEAHTDAAALDPKRVRAECRRSLALHGTGDVRATLERMAASEAALLEPDMYGEGGAVAALEARVATLLGKEAALFVSRGVIAQLAALRVWTDQSGIRTVALHPRSHFELDERNTLDRTLGLATIPVGAEYEPFRLAELEALHEPLGAVTVELPLRRVGLKLPEWSELEAISAWCRSHAVPLHFDGARLWECAAHYDRTHAEIAALADSVYVSFYKVLGAPSGAMLAGSADFIARARIWRSRLGGIPYRNFAVAIAALDGLDLHLPKMSAYRARAREIAVALRAAGFTLTPDLPHTNGFHLFLPGGRAALEAAHLRVAAARGIWFFNRFYDTPLPDRTMVELMIGSAAEEIETGEIVEAIRAIVAAT